MKTFIKILLITLLSGASLLTFGQKDTLKVSPKLKDAFGKLHKTSDTTSNSSSNNDDSSDHGLSDGGSPGIVQSPGGPANPSPSNPGEIVVHADSRIDSLEHKHRKLKLKGYRIQVFMGSFAQCRDERSKFHKNYADIPSYQIQNSPDYTVRIGDYRNLVEAMASLKEIKRTYPGAFIIPDSIEPPKLNKNP
ncbi:MAG: SPOR domain-containing protein [Flavobacteriales bacterium]|nr:SPOR domain-containing protein [Flavobacteriales bacterium]